MGKNILTRILYIVIAALLVILVGSRKVIMSSLKYESDNVENFNEFYAEDFKKNQIVSGDLYCSLGCVVEEYYTNENGHRTSTKNSRQYYLVPVGEEEYMIVSVPSEKFAELDKLTDQSLEYYFGEGTIEPELVPISGRMDKLDKEVKEYLIEWFIDIEFFDTNDVAEMEKYILPYMLTYVDWERSKTSTTVSLSIAGVLILLLVILIVVLLKKTKQSREATAYDFQNPTGENNPYGTTYQPTNSSDPYQSIGNNYSYNPIETPTTGSTYDENQKPPCEL